MSWRRRRKATNAVPFPSGLAKRRPASSIDQRPKRPVEPVESNAAILAVPAEDAASSEYTKQQLIDQGRADPLLQGETITRILQFQKDRDAVKAASRERTAKATKRYDRRWKHLSNLRDFLTQVIPSHTPSSPIAPRSSDGVPHLFVRSPHARTPCCAFATAPVLSVRQRRVSKKGIAFQARTLLCSMLPSNSQIVLL